MDNTTKTTQRPAIFAEFCQQLQNAITWQADPAGLEDSTTQTELPKNAVSGNIYQGINAALLLISARDNNFGVSDWATYKQWYAGNETIRKGEKGTVILRYTIDQQDEANPEAYAASLKLVRVFNCAQLKSWVAE